MADELQRIAFEPDPAFTAKQNAILNALQLGNTRTASAAYAGIHKATFYRWMEENATFCDAVTRAEATAEVGYVAVIQQAATVGKDWRAAESWLKRRRRDDWGDSIAFRADQEAAELIAELFAQNASPDPDAPAE